MKDGSENSSKLAKECYLTRMTPFEEFLFGFEKFLKPKNNVAQRELPHAFAQYN